MKKTILLLILILTGIQSFAQDTLVFTQKKASMFSNRYLLYPKTNRFEHFFSTDDGQTWYGKGEYKITNGKIYLSFGDSENDIKKETEIVKTYDQSRKTDTLVVHFVAQKKDQSIGHIKYKDQYFYTNPFNGEIKIPKSKFDNNENPIVETFILGNVVKIELTALTYLHNVKISAYDFYSHYHFESNFDRVLKFHNNQMTSDDFYNTTNKRKVTFVLLK